MNLKILFLLLMYWCIWLSVSGMTISGFSVTGSLSDISVNASGLPDAGLWAAGVSFGRFAVFALFGIGLPAGMPVWANLLLSLWATSWSIFTVGFLISAIWNG